MSKTKFKVFLKKKGLYLVLLFVLFVFIFVYVLINSLTNNIISSTSYDVVLNVGDYVGLNTDTDKIYFGTVPKGGYSYRELYLTSADEGVLFITVKGEINDLIYLQYSIYRIGRNETISNLIYAKVPNDYKEGSYEAKLWVFVLKRDNSFLNKFLPGTRINILKETLKTDSPNVAINIVNNRLGELI